MIGRSTTNIIRFFLDGFIPSFLRDSKIFMYPFLYIFHKGKNVNKHSDYKSNKNFIYNLDVYKSFYENYDVVITDRETDLNNESVEEIINQVSLALKSSEKSDSSRYSVIDVGCGNMYLLKKALKAFPNRLYLYGADLIDKSFISEKISDGIQFIKIDKSIICDVKNMYDIVISTHVLEHLPDPYLTFQHLYNISKKRLIIVVPKQRYFKYTFDYHLSFFPSEQSLRVQLGIPEKAIIKELGGDFLIVVNK